MVLEPAGIVNVSLTFEIEFLDKKKQNNEKMFNINFSALNLLTSAIGREL